MADAGKRKRARYEKARRLEGKTRAPKRGGSDTAQEPGASARVFVALDLPETVGDGLAAWQRGALADDALRPMRKEALHVTLCFLGHHPEPAVGPDRRARPGARAGAGGDAPRAEAGADPRWPPAPLRGRRPQSPGAVALQARVAEPLTAAGFFKPEEREFWPHVTVARVRSERLPPERSARRGRSRPKRVGKPPRDLPEALLEPFGCVRVALYRSILKSGGAEYERLTGVDLPSSRAGQKR